MKIRNGFVSNSSSSSFIIGLAVVKSTEKVREFLKQANLLNSDGVSMCWWDGEKLTSSDLYPVGYRDDEGCVVISSFRGDLVSLNKKNMRIGSTVLMVKIFNDEGDEFFEICDDRGEYESMNYDIDESHFKDGQEKLFELFKNKELLANASMAFGVDRNG